MSQDRHVLLVDDNPQGIEILQMRLQKLGFRTSTAQNGEQAIEMVRTDPPQIVVMDVTMPELNGFQACREIKKLAPDLPIIILTAKKDPADRFWANQVGADAFLNKPIEPATVVDTLQELLAET